MYRIGKDLRKSAVQDILKKPKNGKVYMLRLKGRLVRHQSSAPGEAPANFSGALRKSIVYKTQGSKQLIFGAGNQNSVKYAKSLELGNKDRHLEPRPYLKKSIDDNDRNTEKHILHMLKKNLEKKA
jgi:hypothetical protein